MLINAGWDKERGLLTSFSKGRGLGDCGTDLRICLGRPRLPPRRAGRDGRVPGVEGLYHDLAGEGGAAVAY